VFLLLEEGPSSVKLASLSFERTALLGFLVEAFLELGVVYEVTVLVQVLAHFVLGLVYRFVDFERGLEN
jgi:hypothetical protein